MSGSPLIIRLYDAAPKIKNQYVGYAPPPTEFEFIGANAQAAVTANKISPVTNYWTDFLDTTWKQQVDASIEKSPYYIHSSASYLYSLSSMVSYPCYGTWTFTSATSYTSMDNMCVLTFPLYKLPTAIHIKTTIKNYGTKDMCGAFCVYLSNTKDSGGIFHTVFRALNVSYNRMNIVKNTQGNPAPSTGTQASRNPAEIYTITTNFPDTYDKTSPCYLKIAQAQKHNFGVGYGLATFTVSQLRVLW